MTQPPEPVWIETELALAIHDRQLAEHGDPIGLRDADGLESPLARPRNQWAYGEADPCKLAATSTYAYGLARNYLFTDGNKRTDWVLARLFLVLNGVDIAYAPEEAVRMVLELAAGELDEVVISNWVTERRA